MGSTRPRVLLMMLSLVCAIVPAALALPPAIAQQEDAPLDEEEGEISSSDILDGDDKADDDAGAQTEIQLLYVLQDGLIRKVKEYLPPGGSFTSGYMLSLYEITEKGRDFIKIWLDPREEIL
ncbi:MAG: hypothetical protein M3275_00930 [Thermoproteota archaeon]|nr:hypothetical protein [Thermoproteota archaeon]